MKTWRGALVLIIGVFLGALAFSALSASYYMYSGLYLEMEMGPQMFVVFSPILAMPIVIIALLIHILLSSYFNFDRYWKWFLSGISYASVFLSIISLWFLIIPFFLNPFSIKLIAKLKQEVDTIKKILKILLIVLLIISGLSAISYYHFWSMSNIDEISLKKKGNFKITNQTLEFKLNQLKNVNYYLAIKFMSDNYADIVALTNARYTAGQFNVTVQLIDDKGDVVKMVAINAGSTMPGGWSNESVEWYLANFIGADARDKIVKINFQSDDSLFDRLPKEIYLVQVFDYESLAWWGLFERISVIALCISLVLSGIVSLILLKRKDSSQ